MTIDWKEQIAVAVLVRQHLDKLGYGQIYPYHLPKTKGSVEQIREVESILGFNLDENYAKFLLHANGWEAFTRDIDLFGTEELRDTTSAENAQIIFDSLEKVVLDGSKVRKDEMLLIAGSRHDRDIFVQLKSQSNSPGSVIWFAGEEIERYSNFIEFFLTTVDYNRASIERTEKE